MSHEVSSEVEGVPFEAGLAAEVAPLGVGQDVDQKVAEVPQQLLRLGEVEQRRLSVVGWRQRHDERAKRPAVTRFKKKRGSVEDEGSKLLYLGHGSFA